MRTEAKIEMRHAVSHSTMCILKSPNTIEYYPNTINVGDIFTIVSESKMTFDDERTYWTFLIIFQDVVGYLSFSDEKPLGYRFRPLPEEEAVP